MKIIKVFIGILISFAILYYFIWSGIKGMLSFIIGMGVMAAILFSNSPIILWILEQTKSKHYIEELKRI